MRHIASHSSRGMYQQHEVKMVNGVLKASTKPSENFVLTVPRSDPTILVDFDLCGRIRQAETRASLPRDNQSRKVNHRRISADNPSRKPEEATGEGLLDPGLAE